MAFGQAQVNSPSNYQKFNFSFQNSNINFKNCYTGKHTYSTFPLLEDFTDQGVAWNTWENLVVIPWNDTPYP